MLIYDGFKKVIEYNGYEDVHKLNKFFNTLKHEVNPICRWDIDLGCILYLPNRSFVLPVGCIIAEGLNDNLYILNYDKGIILN